MPFVIRNTLTFRTRGYGWKETWFSQQNTGDLTPPMNYLSATLAVKRSALLGNQSQVENAEVSIELDDTGKPFIGDSALVDLAPIATTTADSAAPDVALLVRCSNDTRQRRRNVFFRGIWDSVEVQGGKFVSGGAAGPWQTSWLAYIAALNGLGDPGMNGAGWIRTDKIINTALVPSTYKIPILTAVQNAAGYVDFTTSADVTWPLGVGQRNRIRINTARVKSQLAGSLVVVPSGARAFTTAFKIAILPTDTTGWYGFTVGPSFQRITFFDPERITSRKVGKALYLTPGRRPARART